MGYIYISTSYISFSDKDFRKRMFVRRQDLPGLPIEFRNDVLKNIRVVIDCTPIFIEKPGNYKKQSNTFSVYKQANVYTLLIGTTPWGGMAYMSVPFEGAMSDRRIVEESDFLPFLEEGDDVLGKTNLFSCNRVISTLYSNVYTRLFPAKFVS